MKYHVTGKWDGGDLETLAQIMGENEAIEAHCEKWGTDGAHAADHVHKIFLYASLTDAQTHQSLYGGEILGIDDTELNIDVDIIEGYEYVSECIYAEEIRVVS